METLIAHPTNEAQHKALTAVMEALQIPYETERYAAHSPYNAVFVAKVMQGLEDDGKGLGKIIPTEDLWK